MQIKGAQEEIKEFLAATRTHSWWPLMYGFWIPEVAALKLVLSGNKQKQEGGVYGGVGSVQVGIPDIANQ